MVKYPIAFFILASLAFAINRPPAENGLKIEIAGSAEFKQQVAKALILLRKKAPEEYEIVKKHIGKIEENERSGMLAYKEPPVYQMSLKTAFYSITWCAGTIAHDAYHSKLYHDYEKRHGKPVPYDEWAGFEAEKKCIKYQLETLGKIKAPENEMDYCLSLDGTHGDVNHDGKIDKTDYELRDW
ncbi:MAG: hypothetical protein HY746_04845 [Elusimicrobia bacterium]|nr:hypothetical protein [Elusimicrobiota bacterium]